MVALTDAKRYKVHQLLLNATEVPEAKVMLQLENVGSASFYGQMDSLTLMISLLFHVEIYPRIAKLAWVGQQR